MEDRVPVYRSWCVGRLVRVGVVVGALLVAACVFASSALAWGGGEQSSSFTIEKEQRLAGQSGYTKSELTGKIGETVEYRVVVKNTGSVQLALGEFSDPNCDPGTLGGGPSGELAPGGSATYTCRHVLTEVGTYSNTAYVTGTGRDCFPSEVSSNTVVVDVPVEPAAAIEKLQEIKGSGAGFTTKELTASVGQTVDYEIIVRNTGSVPVKLSGFTDGHCENISGGPGSSELQPNQKTVYTCDHVLTEPGSWSNVASVQSTGNEHMCGRYMSSTLTSNTVVVKVAAAEAFTVLKEQRLGSSGSYTTEKLTGKLGETVDYLITVTNTGGVSLKLQKITDADCSNVSGPSQTELAPGGKATYTCEHKLTATGTWTNVATVESCTGKTGESNKVEVMVPEEAKFEVVKEQKLAGESSYTKSKLVGKLGQVVLYLITVKNTGNVTLHLAKISDPDCTNIVGPAKSELAAGESTTYTCEHELTAVGVWKNVAEVETCSCNKSKTERSNEVETEVKPEQKFEVKKEQRIGTSGGYTPAKLTAKVGETIDYLITVTSTGNAPIKLQSITDADCSNMSAPSKTELAPHESATYTCEHKITTPGIWTNVATVESCTNEKHESNKVEVETPFEPEFTVGKLQRVSGGSYTKAPVEGKAPLTVEYEIVVTNTGKVPVTVESIKDVNVPGCETTSPKQPEVKVGESAVVESTCSHTITGEGETFKNAATVKVNGKEETPEEVESKTKLEPHFKAAKLQRLAGGTFSAAPVEGKAPLAVEYEIVVTNTGKVPVTVESIKDVNVPGCETTSPKQPEVKVGESAVVESTCSHTITGEGETFKNAATVKVNGKEETPEEVESKTKLEPHFKAAKLQRLAGGTFSAAPVEGKAPLAVEYEIVVTNTGKVPVTVESIKDVNVPGCETTSPKQPEVKVGESAVVESTCSHTITGEGETFKNAATVKVNGKEETPEEVESKTKLEPHFKAAKLQRLAGGTFSAAPVEGKAPLAVEYEIVVTNTGKVPVTVESIKDVNVPGCETTSPKQPEVKVGESAVVESTCSHTITGEGETFKNAATVKVNGKEETPEEVESKTKLEPHFKAAKLQRLAGGTFSAAPVEGKAPLAVEYEIVVTNTGKVPVTVESIKDVNVPGCETTSPKQPEVKVGESAVVESTCSHTITGEGETFKNAATVKVNGKEETPEEVESKTKLEPHFKAAKLQRLAGGTFSAAPVEGKAPLAVEYEIVVTNTGKVPVTVESIKDVNVPGCETTSPKQPEVKVGESAVVESTCSHTITGEGETFKNAATVKVNGKEETPEEVESKTKLEPHFKAAKLQRLAGGTFSAAPVEGKAPLAVEYEIVVTNTGKVPVTVESIKDVNVPGCETTSPKQPEVKVGESAVVESTCSHTITGEGETFKNAATVKVNGKEETPEEVESKTKLEPHFAVEKLQKIAGGSFTKEPVEGVAPLTVEYEIVVTNTGKVPVTVESIKDVNVPGCETTSPKQPEVKVGESAVVESTCSHTLPEAGETFTNVATVKASKEEKPTPPVEAKTKNEAPRFVVEKLQRLAGGTYGTGKLLGAPPLTVEYEIVVSNTGNKAITVEAIKDANVPGCETTAPNQATVKIGEAGVVEATCSHTINGEGETFTNVASVKASGEEETTGQVEAETESAEFTLVKEQRFAGETEYTKTAKAGKVGQVVEYRIVVTDSGPLPITLESIADTKCTNIAGPMPSASLKHGESATYTCEHTLEEAGIYRNVATVEASDTELVALAKAPNESHKLTRTSNEVVVYAPSFTIVKLQRIKGSGQEFTTLDLTATVGQVVEYKVVVSNTEALLALVFSNFSDANCTNIAGGPGVSSVPPAGSATFTCEHTLTSVGQYVNEASIEASEGVGTEGPISLVTGPKLSNRVITNVGEAPKQAVKAVCAISESSITLNGGSGSKRKPFTIHLPALGIKQVTFYLDGRKLKTLSASQAKHGVFSVTLDPRKLSYGAHKLSVKTVMADSACAPVARAAVFVHPRASRVSPKFTG